MTAAAGSCTSCGAAAGRGAVFCRSCGTALDLAGNGVRTQKSPRPPNVRGWRRHAGRALVAVVVVTVLATAAVIFVRQKTDQAPDAPVRAWFAALAARDTAAAAAVRPGIDVLRGDLLRSPAYTPPTDVQILRTSYAPTTDEQQRPNHRIAYVMVRYQIAGTWFEHSIHVNRTGSGTSRPWTLGDGATASLTVIAGILHTAWIGPIAVATASSTDAASASDTIIVPPGRYVIGPDTADPLFTADPVTVTAAGRTRDQPPTIATLTATVKPETVKAVDKLVHTRIDDCAMRKTLSMPDCPFDRTAGPYTGTVATVRWTIRRYPTTALTPVARPYAGGPIVALSTTTPGTARVTYSAVSTGGKAVTETIEFTVDGDIRLHDGQLTWTGGKSGRLI